MNTVNVRSETVNYCDQGEEKTFINKLLGEMKSQFNKADINIDYTDTDKNNMNENSLKSNEVDEDLINKDSDSSKNVGCMENLVPESTNDQNQTNEEHSTDQPRIVLLFKKPNNESPNKNKDTNSTSPGRRSLRNKNSIDDKNCENVFIRSSRRRSKDCNESILQSAIARKEKSYNESSKPQRLSRLLKPTQKILDNLALAKQEKNKNKSPKNNDSDLQQSDDTNSSDTSVKRHKKQTKAVKKNVKRRKITHDESDKDTESDESLSADSEQTLYTTQRTRRSERLSSRVKEESDVPANPSPSIADQPSNFPDDPECSSVGTEILASRLCLCTQKTKYFGTATEIGTVYCNAVDSVGDKLIGCNRIANIEETPLLRPSQRVPYLTLCNLHRNRLIRHNCCPTCGVFCTQGFFVECEANHQYHRSCQISIGNLECCPHCGLSNPPQDIFIEMHCSTMPVFLPTQRANYPSAKMGFTKLEENRSNRSSPLLIPIETFQIFNTLRLENNDFTIDDLIDAVKDEDVSKLASIIAADTIDLHFKIPDFNDGTLLHYAAHKGLLKICHLLISSGLDINEFDKEQNTPLTLAINGNNNEVVQYLVGAGANISLKATDGMTPLHHAAKSGNLHACRLLLATSSPSTSYIDQRDDGGWTALVWASEHGRADVVRFLLAKGADPRSRDVEQNEALHWAAFGGGVEAAQALLDGGADVDTRNAHGETPLHIAAREDKYNCAIVLLARGADVTVVNKNNETPLECVPDDGDCYNAIALNVRLQPLTNLNIKKYRTIISNDISNGKEVNPIQCVNTVDDETEPKDYVYITKNCITSDEIKMDNKITTMRSCSCEERCTSSECECSKLSRKCWFDEEGKLTSDFCFADAPMIFECNEACQCNSITCRNRVVQRGLQQRFQLFKTDGKGWGIKALRLIPKGSYVCEYIGEILTDVEANGREEDNFLFDLDNKEQASFCVDARHYGNFARFINHSCTPNLHPVKVFIDHQDLRFPRIALFSLKDIQAEEELSFDYGHKFWLVKYKSFKCQCSSNECKYSEDTIEQTLLTYKGVIEEGH